jgi:dTMP kinase
LRFALRKIKQKDRRGQAPFLQENKNNMKGILITFEGIDYSGKTTHVKKLVGYLRRKGYKVILLREPGGEKISESIRQVLLSSKNIGMNPLTELLLYIASRAQLVSKIILPALKQGKIVICDRFYDSTLAYLNKISVYKVKPDLTILVDIPIEIFVKRMRKNNKKKDRIEKEKIGFYKKVREGYLKIARGENKRFRVIDGSEEIVRVWEKVKTTIDNFLKLE